ncbi:PAS domain-containing protein [Ekhidna sp.]|uniref:PAS domain-containing protein n=1 Tax=Ekhidna sp. TaxID=2608089 RepID=UPI003511DDF0
MKIVIFLTLLTSCALLDVLEASNPDQEFANSGQIADAYDHSVKSVSQCSSNYQSLDFSLSAYFGALLSTENWPARWTCGNWSSVEGWMYISADFSIFIAYLSIPIILFLYIRKRNLGKARRLVVLFAAFILLCGFTHLIDVVLFWEPMYRLSGFVKLLTGAISLTTAIVLGFIIPKALKFKSPEILQAEIDEKKRLQNQFELFVKFSPGAIAMVDTEMRYIMANKGWYKDYGIEEQEIIGKSHYEVFPQILEMPLWLDYHKRALSGEKLKNDFDSFQNGDDITYLRWKLEPWYNSDDTVGGIIMFTEVINEEVLIQKKLKESERKFTNIFNKAQFAIALVGDEGIPFLVNSQFCELLGYSEDELTSMSFVEFTHPEDVDKDMTRYQKLLNNEIDSYTIDKRYITKSGEIKYVKLNVTLVDEGTEKEYALALIEDITESELIRIKEKEAEQKMKAMNKTFVEISSLAKIGTWEVDVLEGKCYWSDTVYRIHEEEPSKVISLEDGINYYHPDHREIINKAVENGIAKNQPWDLELKIITAKGNVKWTRAIGRAVFRNDQVVKLQGLFQDVDDKVKAEIKINENTNRLELLNQRFSMAKLAANLGVWDWDIINNKLTWDSEMYEIYGVEESEFENTYETWKNGLHPEDRERSSQEVQDCFDNNKKLDTHFRVIKGDGKVRYIKALGEVIRNKKGDPVRMIGVNWDITREIEWENEVKELNESLKARVEERTKALQIANEELEAFSYSVSHDLRAPLRAINGYSEALIEDYSSTIPKDAQNYLSRISANSKKMGALIDDLLEFSRMNRKKVNYKEVDLNLLIKKLINDLFPMEKERIIIHGLPIITGDQEMLGQVLSNLISNAIKYSSKNKNPEIIISAMNEDDSVVIYIKDNGVGFNMLYYDKLFNVFQRLHSESEFEGTGVGLSLCDKIMKAHEGEIWADSTEGEGATFYLRFKKE